MVRHMEPNRNDHTLPSRLDLEIFHGFGDNDSIVDRLLSLPVAAPSDEGKLNAWDVGVTRRLEKLLADRMRKRIETSVEQRHG
jgi:hypothetical protein